MEHCPKFLEYALHFLTTGDKAATTFEPTY